MRERGVPMLPHQCEALDRSRAALDAARPNAATDLGAAFVRQPELVGEAANGRTQAAIRAMKLEAEIRADPFRRADRFVDDWQALQKTQTDLRRDGDRHGAKRIGQSMAGMAKSLERDAQVESLLRGRRQELGIGKDIGRSIANDLASIASFDPAKTLGLGR